jgi:hypothetical protein
MTRQLHAVCFIRVLGIYPSAMGTLLALRAPEPVRTAQPRLEQTSPMKITRI